MGYPVGDDFNRPDGPLGTSSSGRPWLALTTAAISIVSAKAQPTAGSIAVLEAGLDSQDGTVNLGLAGGGVAAFFRVVDALNWWALSQRAFTYQVQTGTYTYQSGTETYIIGYTVVEYEWRQNYGSHPEGDQYNIHFKTAWSTSSTTAPYFPSSIGHNHYYGTDSNSDLVTHYHGTSGAPFTTGAQRGGDPIYGSRAVYTTVPVYETRTGYAARLERSVNGTVTVLSDIELADRAATANLRAIFNGDQISTFAGATALYTVPALEATAHATATRHGIGARATVATIGQATSFTFTPTRGGLYVPAIMK